MEQPIRATASRSGSQDTPESSYTANQVEALFAKLPLPLHPPKPSSPPSNHPFFFGGRGRFVYTAIAGFNLKNPDKIFFKAAAGGKYQEPQSFTKITDFIGGGDVEFVLCFFYVLYFWTIFFSVACDQFTPPFFFTLSQS